MARTARIVKPRLSSAAPGPAPIRSMSPIMTTNGGAGRDSQALFEKLLLDGFQAGLSGSPSCASAMRSVPPFAASIRRRSPASPLPTGSG